MRVQQSGLHDGTMARLHYHIIIHHHREKHQKNVQAYLPTESMARSKSSRDTSPSPSRSMARNNCA